jgi:hypothetical protein
MLVPSVAGPLLLLLLNPTTCCHAGTAILLAPLLLLA